MLEFQIHKLKRLEFEKVQFYTIRYLDAKASEFKSFVDKVNVLAKNDQRCQDNLDVIFAQIEKIGNKFGATPKRFKFEEEAFALATHYPNNNKTGVYGLRVYCLILNENIVILLNGGDKKNLKNKNCKNVSMHFSNAKALSKVFDGYVKDGTLILNAKQIVNPLDEGLYQT